MARFLSIDCDSQQLYVVAASSTRGGVRVEHTLTWPLPEPLSSMTAENLGRLLRDALKSAGMAPAPVLACVGQERVILQEIRYPAVAPKDEPALVRFQVKREMTDSPEDVIIDYAPFAAGAAGGENRAIAVIVRKEVIQSLHGLCRGLGQKLLAVTPRPIALLGALDRGRTAAAPAGAVEALMTVGQRRADLGVWRDKTLLFARSLNTGPALAGEVKRSLAVFSAQTGSMTQTLSIAGNGDAASLKNRLTEMLTIPVTPLDPFTKDDRVPGAAHERGLFSAAVGLAHRWALAPQLAINLVAPKEPRQETDPVKRKKVFFGIVAAVLVVVGIVFANVSLANKRSAVDALRKDKTELETDLKKFAQDRLDIDALKDFEQGAVPWLDEIYQLAAHFPHKVGFRVTQLKIDPPGKKSSKDKYVATVSIHGVFPAGEERLVREWQMYLSRDPHLRATLKDHVGNKFHMIVDVASQPRSKYQTRLVVPPAPKAVVPEPDDEYDLPYPLVQEVLP
ncbi:MAG: hypothetical protein L0Y72_14045 [Gemmataceae bacterium]|nr:hypothetical protein [Gemmataceae bacterium]